MEKLDSYALENGRQYSSKLKNIKHYLLKHSVHIMFLYEYLLYKNVSMLCLVSIVQKAESVGV